MELRWKISLFSKRSHIFSFIGLLSIIYLISQYNEVFPVSVSRLTESKSQLDDPSVLSTAQTKLTKEIVPDNGSLYYRQATSERNSSYPFISGDTFRAFADFIFDETRKDRLKNLIHGDSIFLKGDMLSVFFPSVFNSIKEPFVLISHNSDFGAPSRHDKYLNDTKILHWYASNPTLRNHPKLSPIPIGLANTRWSYGNIDRLLNASLRFRKPWAQRTTTLYVNFDASTNRVQRQKALQQALTLSPHLVQRISQKLTPETYLEQVGNAKFVLSPPGNGLDCHRTWEALLMGAAPVVVTSSLDPLFHQAPVVILNDWSDLTEDLLQSRNFSAFDNTLVSTLTAQYWYAKIRSHRQQ